MFKILVDFAVKSRHVMMNSRRSIKSYNRPISVHHRVFKFEKYRALLMRKLGLEKQTAGKILCRHQTILDIPKEQLEKQCHLCNKLLIDPRSLIKNAKLLGWRSHTLKNRAMLLKDMGVICPPAAVVSNFDMVVLMRMGMFKAYIGIPKAVNVADNLLQCLHEPPPSVPPLEELSDDLSVKEYHKRCLRWYIRWRLNVPKEDEITTDHILRHLRYRSFSLMRSLFDTLHIDIGLSIEQIKTHNCLSAGTAEDLRAIIDKIGTFAGVDFKKLIRRCPALHAMEYENVREIMRLLDEYGYTNAARIRCPEILLLDSSLIATRLKTMEEVPELRVLKNNLRVLSLIHDFHVAQIRLEYLRYLNIKNATVRLLVGQIRNFERFVKTGLDRTRGKEIAFSLGKRLRLEGKEIRRSIQKHPYWRHVDLVSLHDTLDFLLEHFDQEDLYDSLQILLYPREKIAEALKILSEQDETSDLLERLTPKQIVASCLYEIEREHHFSGDGVWKYDTPLPRRSSAENKQIEPTDSDGSDSETAEPEEQEESLRDEQINTVKKRRGRRIFHDVVNKNVNK